MAYNQPQNVMNQRMAQRPGASPGGLQPSQGSPPPPPMGGQHPPGAAPPQDGTPMFQVPELQSLAAKLVAGDPAVLDELGRFMMWMQELVQGHGQAQGTPPMGGAPPAMGGAPPAMGGGTPPMGQPPLR